MQEKNMKVWKKLCEFQKAGYYAAGILTLHIDEFLDCF